MYDCDILSVLVIEILQSWTDTTLCRDHFGYRLIQWAHTQNDLCFETYSPYLGAAIWVCFLSIHLSKQRLKLYFILQDAGQMCRMGMLILLLSHHRQLQGDSLKWVRDVWNWYQYTASEVIHDLSIHWTCCLAGNHHISFINVFWGVGVGLEFFKQNKQILKLPLEV